MVLYHVKLKGRTLVIVTDLTTAQELTKLLNNGTLYGVEGDLAAYEDARGERLPSVPAETTIYVEQTGPGDPVGQLGAVGEQGLGCEIAEDGPVATQIIDGVPCDGAKRPIQSRTTRRRKEQNDGSPPDAQG